MSSRAASARAGPGAQREELLAAGLLLARRQAPAGVLAAQAGQHRLRAVHVEPGRPAAVRGVRHASGSSASPAVQIAAMASPAPTLPGTSMPASTMRTPSAVVAAVMRSRTASSTSRCTSGRHRALTLSCGPAAPLRERRSRWDAMPVDAGLDRQSAHPSSSSSRIAVGVIAASCVVAARVDRPPPRDSACSGHAAERVARPLRVPSRPMSWHQPSAAGARQARRDIVRRRAHRRLAAPTGGRRDRAPRRQASVGVQAARCAFTSPPATRWSCSSMVADGRGLTSITLTRSPSSRKSRLFRPFSPRCRVDAGDRVAHRTGGRSRQHRPGRPHPGRRRAGRRHRPSAAGCSR